MRKIPFTTLIQSFEAMSNTFTGLVVVGLGVSIAIVANFAKPEHTDKYLALASTISVGGIGIIGTTNNGK